MMNRKVALAICCGIMALAMAIPAMAAVIYVNINNSGVEDGSQEHPYNTITEAINIAASRDTIKVAPGVYPGNLAINAKALKLEGEAPAATTIQGTAVTITVSGAFSDVVEITGFTITGGVNASGIYLNSSTVKADIHNNIIVGNKTGIYCEAAPSIIISNNIIANNSGNGIYGDNSDNITVSNNIIVTNSLYGIYGYFSTILVTNNTLSANNSGSYYDNGTEYTQIGNTYQDPLLVPGSYFLSAGSPSIDAGTPLYAQNDPNGTRNDQGVYGGPGAANFWPEPAGGPVVTSMSVSPPSVPVGGTLTLKATGKIR
jgi:parallel beta-helix repeat protein